MNKKMERDSRLPAVTPVDVPPLSIISEQGDDRHDDRRRKDHRRGPSGGNNRHRRRY